MSELQRLSQWERLKELDRRIRARQFPTARELSVEWDLTERAVYKDRAHLVKMGARIGIDRARGGWVYLDPTFVLGTALLTNDELLAFLLSVEVARAGGNTGLDALLDSAVGKIKEALGDTVSVARAQGHAPDNSYGLAPVAAVTSDVHLQLTPGRLTEYSGDAGIVLIEPCGIEIFVPSIVIDDAHDGFNRALWD